MVVEMLLAAEGFVAEGASVRHVSGMLPDVVVEMLLPAERLGAVGALVRRLASVLAAADGSRCCFVYVLYTILTESLFFLVYVNFMG